MPCVIWSHLGWKNNCIGFLEFCHVGRCYINLGSTSEQNTNFAFGLSSEQVLMQPNFRPEPSCCYMCQLAGLYVTCKTYKRFSNGTRGHVLHKWYARRVAHQWIPGVTLSLTVTAMNANIYCYFVTPQPRPSWKPPGSPFLRLTHTRGKHEVTKRITYTH
jgi:hypothetical protein